MFVAAREESNIIWRTPRYQTLPDVHHPQQMRHHHSNEALLGSSWKNLQMWGTVTKKEGLMLINKMKKSRIWGFQIDRWVFEWKPGFSSGLLLSIPVNGISFSMNDEDPCLVFLR